MGCTNLGPNWATSKWKITDSHVQVWRSLCLINIFFLVVKGCDDTTYENNTYFSSTNYASPCVLKVCKLNANICQIRLDFDTFDIAQPESSTTPIVTNCVDARFSTTSQGATMPILCGTNTGKHSKF